MTLAVEQDLDGNLDRAYQLYYEGLQCYVPIIVNEMDSTRKQHFRDQANEYMRRAEEIKSMLKPKTLQAETNKTNVITFIEPTSMYNELCKAQR